MNLTVPGPLWRTLRDGEDIRVTVGMSFDATTYPNALILVGSNDSGDGEETVTAQVRNRTCVYGGLGLHLTKIE